MTTRKQNAQQKLQELAYEEEQESIELAALVEEIDYLHCEESLSHYVESAWSHFNSSPFVHNWHVDAIADHLQACLLGDIKDLIISVPPRFGKSSLVSVAGPTWMWGPAGQPDTKFLTFSYGARLSMRDAGYSRQLMNCGWYRRRWSSFHLLGDVNRQTRYENNFFGYRLSSSVGGLGTGEGYDVMVVDDPLKAADHSSTKELEKVIEWWSGTLSTRANDPNTARRIIIMQRLAQNDLTGYILENPNNFVHLKLPMEYIPNTWISPVGGWFDPRTFKGELLDYNRFSGTKVEALKSELKEYKYSAQYQQEPAPQGGGLVKSTYFRYYHATYQVYDVIVQSWDLAVKDAAKADWSVGQVWGVKGPNLFLLDMVRRKMGTIEQIECIMMLRNKYPTARAILIEEAQTGSAVRQMLERKIPGVLGIKPTDFGGTKEQRLISCLPDFEAGNVYLPDPTIAPWIHQVIEELLLFPKANHDDCVDALTQALNWLARKGRLIYVEPIITQESYHHSAEYARSLYSEQQARATPKQIRGIFGE